MGRPLLLIGQLMSKFRKGRSYGKAIKHFYTNWKGLLRRRTIASPATKPNTPRR